MIRYVTAFVAARSSHPILAGLLITAGLLGGAGLVTEQVLQPGVGSGFLVVYAVIAASLGGLGYAILLVTGLVSRLRRGGENDPLSVEVGSTRDAE